MFFTKIKLKKIRFRAAIFLLASMLSGFSYMEQSIAGGFSSPYSDKLIDGLIDYLIKHDVCDSDSTCGKMIQTRTEGTKRIYINMYGQTDLVVASHAVAFFIEQAPKITEGTPTTLHVYPKTKDEYMNKGFKYAFGNNEYLIKLELNK